MSEEELENINDESCVQSSKREFNVYVNQRGSIMVYEGNEVVLDLTKGELGLIMRAYENIIGKKKEV
jgi:hypothetical protein